MSALGPPPRLMTRVEVAEEFGVAPETVSRWADEGRLECRRTLGGHRRFYRDQVEALLEQERRGWFPADTAEEL